MISYKFSSQASSDILVDSPRKEDHQVDLCDNVTGRGSKLIILVQKMSHEGQSSVFDTKNLFSFFFLFIFKFFVFVYLKLYVCIHSFKLNKHCL